MMDMPTKWWVMHWPPNERTYSDDGFTKVRSKTLDEAIDFLKEMAETLELYEHISHKNDPKDQSQYSAAAETLAKFKKWK